MKKPTIISMLALALALAAAVPLSGGCAVEDSDEEEVLEEVSSAKPGGGGGGGGGQTCDDFDSYCDAAHPCGEGYVCALDVSNCGSNFFGTYPNCGVTATCYPACQPKE